MGAVPGAKGAGDFLLHFHHPDIPLGLVVGERHVGIGEEPERVLFVFLQAQQEVVPGAALVFSARQRGLCLVKGQSFGDDTVVQR